MSEPAAFRPSPALERVIAYFAELTRIPRGSGNEEAVSRFLADWGREAGFAVERDAAGNVRMDCPARPGYEGAPPLLLQAHMDMVCAATEDFPFDFARQPIPMERRWDDLLSPHTTLGADDGVGLSIARYLAAEEPCRGAVRLLFTTDEENGETGADALDPAWLAGDYLLNLDSNDTGVLYLGCAGSRKLEVRGTPENCPPRGDRAFRLVLAGLPGGHSGKDIHRGRVNALTALAALLSGLPVEVAAFSGGSAANAIPVSARCTLVMDAVGEAALRQALPREETRLRHTPEGEAASLTLTPCPLPEGVLTREEGEGLLSFLTEVPAGVLEASPEGVLTSCSTGKAAVAPGTLSLLLMTRSNLSEAAMEGVTETISALANPRGYTLRTTEASGLWRTGWDNPMTQRLYREYTAALGHVPRYIYSHSGVEPAHFALKNPALKMVTIGVGITNGHAPGEKVSLHTVEATLSTLRALLRAAPEWGK